MAEREESTQEQTQQNGHTGRRTAVRAAALAAASGATALAARKAFSHGGTSEGTGGDSQRRERRSGGDAGVVTSMVGSAWSSARDSLVPMIEDAAVQAGEYLAKNGPDLVRESIVPRFIDGFQRAQRSNDDDEE
jgi:hypothetical protein